MLQGHNIPGSDQDGYNGMSLVVTICHTVSMTMAFKKATLDANEHSLRTTGCSVAKRHRRSPKNGIVN